MPEMLLTVEQVADRLQLHPDSVRRQLKRGTMRGIKRGTRWRVPESAVEESTPLELQRSYTRPRSTETPTESDAEAIWQQMTSGKQGDHNAALRTLFAAPDEVRAIIAQRSAQAVAAHYATPDGESELADWRALDGEPFEDDAGDYYGAEEEAEFQAQRHDRRRAETSAE